MKILFLEWKSFGNKDILSAFRKLSYEVYSMPFNNQNEIIHDDAIESQIISKIHEFHPDFVFSFNYFPIISIACNQANIPYVSWVYDNPQVLMYHVTVINPCNVIFTFDKQQYLEFKKNRINTVHYLPLAANTERLSCMTDFSSFRLTNYKTQADISFVGSLYTESHQYYNRLKGISEYTRGYLEGLMNAQKNIYGYNFIEERLKNHPAIIADMKKFLPLTPEPSSVATTEYLFAQYVINRQITATERTEMLSVIGQKYSFDLYTPNKEIVLPGAINHGIVDYYTMAPYVYKSSKINLNFTLRSILSGIPLRCFEILGSEGFLITNYQSDLDDCYTAGEDYVYYEDKNDLLEKIDYYLNHEEERIKIAHNGYLHTQEQHTYTHRIMDIIKYL